MKKNTVFMVFALFVGWVAPAAALSKKQFEKVQARATSDHKVIAFFTMQEVSNSGCPKDLRYTAQRNTAIKRAIPRKGVVVINLDTRDLAKDSPLPEIIRKSLHTPGILIANADCTKVIDSINHKADKARIAEMESKITAATESK